MDMKRNTWDQFTQDAVESGRNGVLCINEDVKSDLIADPVGFYIYTDEYNYNKKQYKCGQSVRGIKRLGEQAGQSSAIIIVDWIPCTLATESGHDQKIHGELHDDGKCQWLHRMNKKSAPGKEWSKFPKDNPSELWRDHLSGKQTRQELTLTAWQIHAIEYILKSIDSGNSVIIAELAARFGKTTAFLALADCLQNKVTIIASYVQEVMPSFKKECRKYTQFENMEFLILNDKNFAADFGRLLASDKQIVVFASVCGGAANERNADIIAAVGDKIVVVDEADRGAHTKSKTPFVKKLAGDSPLILATGTNSSRAKGEHEHQHSVQDFLGVSYFDMLLMRG